MAASSLGRVKVTVNQKVLVHLLAYARFADRDDAPPHVTQQGISETLRVRRSHVTLALQALAGRGLLVVRTMRIVGGARRKKAYFLTPHGYERAREAEAGLAALPVVMLDDPDTEIALGRAPERLGIPCSLRDLLPCLRADGVLDPRSLAGALG